MKTFLTVQLFVIGVAVGLILYDVIRVYVSLGQSLVHLLGAL